MRQNTKLPIQTLSLLLLLLLGWCGSGYGQIVETSREQELPKRKPIVRVHERNNGGILVSMRHPTRLDDGIGLQFFSGSQLLPLIARDILFPEKGRFLNLFVEPNYVDVYWTREDSAKGLEIWVRKLGLGLEELGRDTLIYRIENVKSRETVFAIREQMNTRVLISWNTKQKEGTGMGYVLLEGDNSMVTKGEAVLATEKEMFIIQATTYGEKGVAYIVNSVEANPDKSKRVQGRIFYSENGGPMRMYPDKDNPLWIEDGVLRNDMRDSSLIVVGLVSAKDSTGSTGVVQIVKREGKGEKIQKHPYGANVLEARYGKYPKSNIIRDLKVDHVGLTQDGGLVVLLERYSVVTETQSSSSVFGDYGSDWVNYKYEELVAMHISAKGRVEWEQVIPKRQISLNDDGLYSSVGVLMSPNSMRLIYNDVSRKDWNLSSIAMDSTGRYQQNLLVGSAKYSGRLIPRMGKQVSSRAYVMPGYNKKKFYLVRITAEQ